MARKQAWGAFWLLGLIWGSSFLLIGIGVKELKPMEVVFIRTAIAAVGLNALLVVRGIRYPPDGPTRRALIIIGIGNIAAPFTLITWGEQYIPSSIAGVLQSTAALFTLIVAHFVFADERITSRRILGIVIGFIGVVVLFSRRPDEGKVIAPIAMILGQLAIVAASLYYAVFTTYGRKIIRTRIEPLVISAATVTTGAVVSGILVVVAPMVNGTPPLALSSISLSTLAAVTVLGLLNTFVAYVFYYQIVRELGASIASMVTFVVPMVSLFLGTIINHEPFDALLGIGALLIFGGIGIVNLKLFRSAKPKPVVSETPVVSAE